MDAVTYPDENVQRFINENLIPLRIPADSKPYADDFRVKWTPTLVTLGPDSEEHHRTVGFLPPQELIPSLLLGMAKFHFDHDRFHEAKELLSRLDAEYGESDAAPEALYLAGVCGYKASHDVTPLKQAYEGLASRFPDNEWTKRAAPYRLL